MRREINIQRAINAPEDHCYWAKPARTDGANTTEDAKEEIHDSRGFKSFVDTPLYVEILSQNEIYKDLFPATAPPAAEDGKKKAVS